MRPAEALSIAPGVAAGAAGGAPAGVEGGTRAAPLRGERGACPPPATAWQRLRRAAYARSPLLRSTAFRIGIFFWLLFTACAGVAGYSFYSTVQHAAIGKLDDSITDRLGVIRTVYASQGLDGVLALADQRDAMPMGTVYGLHLAAPNGTRLVGNVPEAPVTEGWSLVQGSDLGIAGDDERYRFYVTALDDNRLAIGRDLRALEELRAIALNCLLWAFAMSSVLSLLATLLLMRRSRRRMEGIGQALERLADGQLTARVPVSSASDDIDAMALTVNAALDRLHRNVDSLRQVSTDIAHDLKTPLNRLYIQLDDAAVRAAGLGSESGDAIVTALDEALAEAGHINDTFEALLRVAQIEAGSRRANFKHFDLTETLATACEIYAPVVEESCAGLVTRFDAARSLPMYGDRELVLQLVVNLIENAIRHGCAEAGPDTIVAVEAGERDGVVWLAVIDSGPGIPPEQRDKVFQRLYRLEQSRTTRGSGLGLNLVKAIAELHCGAFLLGDGEPGRLGPGLRFEVEFDRDCPLEKARRHLPAVVGDAPDDAV